MIANLKSKFKNDKFNMIAKLKTFNYGLYIIKILHVRIFLDF